MAATNPLGIDLDLLDPADARARIISSCVRCWFERNPSGHRNWGDCSGFVKAVQKDLGLRPFTGQANDIYSEVVDRNDWLVLGHGAEGASKAGAAANAGALTVAVWENRAQPGEPGWARHPGHGHIAIVTAYLPMLGHTPEQHSIGAWGQLGKVGHLMDRMSQSFGHGKRASIRYARSLSAIF
ncbi:MAG TPA: hypothetical protein VL484_15555 [Vicinamibacterales bacterium]|nr:hypothetical protein [Vicinamibacterales bacterium]